MTESLSDRLLETLGDSVARQALRCLLESDQTQNDLIEQLGVAQATVSRAVRVLRSVGLVASTHGHRGEKLRIEVCDAVAGLFLAADRLAEDVLDAQVKAQREGSTRTRRASIKPAQVGPSAQG